MMVEINLKIKSVTAFAPATCANVAVGFDLLGFPIAAVGDTVTLTQNEKGVNITAIEAIDLLPDDPTKNVASSVIIKFCEDFNIQTGFDVSIKKGIALGSGMGGSAASSCAALVALNGFLEKPLPLDELARYAIYGETVASRHAHADNVVPCLYGGLTLVSGINPVQVHKLPIPDIVCVLVHPALRLDTRHARDILPKDMALSSYVQQTRNLAGFFVALYEKNLELLQASLKDVLIEPHRSALVKGFAKVKQAALKAGALGASLSGSGPSVFAFAKNERDAHNIAKAMVEVFASVNIKAQSWVSLIDTRGAKIIAIMPSMV